MITHVTLTSVNATLTFVTVTLPFLTVNLSSVTLSLSPCRSVTVIESLKHCHSHYKPVTVTLILLSLWHHFDIFHFTQLVTKNYYSLSLANYQIIYWKSVTRDLSYDAKRVVIWSIARFLLHVRVYRIFW